MFLVFSNYFDVLMSKIIFFKKNIICMYFSIKNYLKSNCTHTAKYTHFIANHLLNKIINYLLNK